MANPAHHKVEKSLKYRWGIVGGVLAIGFVLWYASTSGRISGKNSFLESNESTRNLVKIVCPRCNNNPATRDDCALCGGRGMIWVDSSLDKPAGNPTP